jgi:hypothetical protein
MGKLDDLINKLDHKIEIVVGFPKDKQVTYPPDDRKGRHGKGGETVAEVAFKNEYGAKNVYWQDLNEGRGGYIDIPSRPFIRNAYRKNKDLIQKMVKAYFKPTNFKDPTYFDKIGIKMKQMIQDSIMNGNWKANSARTVKIKKSDRPLVDRRIMYNNVAYEVRRS